jgi:hypothetical protein
VLEPWDSPCVHAFVEIHVPTQVTPFHVTFYRRDGNVFKPAQFKKENSHLLGLLNSEQHDWLLDILKSLPKQATRPSGVVFESGCALLSDSEFEKSNGGLSLIEQENANAEMLRLRNEHAQYVKARTIRDQRIGEYLRNNRTS